MQQDAIVFVLLFLLPSVLIIVLARKIVAYNARLYPRIYGRVDRVLASAVLYGGSLWWLVQGVMFLAKAASRNSQ